MKKSEFLTQLKKALEHDLDAKAVKANVDYYDDYIQSEINHGKSEDEVMEQLGDPWAIAKTILLSHEMGGQEYGSGYETVPDLNEKEKRNVSVNIKGWVAIAILIVAVVLILAIVFGVLALVIRFAVPLLVIIVVIRWFSTRE